MNDVLEIIASRRDGVPHNLVDLRALASGAAAGTIPDYQLAAWLMAAYLQPMSRDETANLTLAMAESGERLDLSGLPKPWVDKHSTGGVGDKTTLIALPILAACGLTVAKMSGRGLGITGGTVDKLGAVPGLRLDLSPDEMLAQAKRIGLALTGQTPCLAPADGVLYALRDATATVGSIPLIVSSILSKKLAAGAETVVLDVKCGSGAFMTDLGSATALAEWLQDVGTQCGMRTRCVVTDMDQPLGRAVGNALEVREAGEVLRGQGPTRVRDLTLGLCAEALATCGAAPTVEAGLGMAARALSSGAALGKAEVWFEAQGASAAALSGTGLPVAPWVETVVSAGAGWAHRVDAREIGQAVVHLGGGRRAKSDAIDPSVGIEVLVEVADRVEVGSPLARVHAASEGQGRAASEAVRRAVVLGTSEIARRPWRWSAPREVNPSERETPAP